MKNTITNIKQQSEEAQEPDIVTHRLKPKKRQDFDAKSLSIADRTGISSNQLLSSISPKLYPRSISLSSDSRQSTFIFDKQEVRISCLDNLTIPNFTLSHQSGSLEFEELKRTAIRKKIKSIVSIPNCIHKTKKICTQTNCSVNKRWKTKLVLAEHDLHEADRLRKTIGQLNLKEQKQIQKDIYRSFATNVITKTKITLYHASSDKNSIFQMLKTVLKMISKSDPDVGYVQGMNLYMAVVVSHIKDIGYSYSFVRQIMKYGNMRNMYINKFQKLKEQTEHLLHRHVKILMNDLYQVMMQGEVESQIFMPFYLSMFGCVVDYSIMPSIIDQFMSKGFLFLDKLMVSMLCYMKNQLIFCDSCEISYRLGASYIRNQMIEWEEIVNLSQVIDLN